MKLFWIGLVTIPILCLGLAIMASCGDEDDDNDDVDGCMG